MSFRSKKSYWRRQCRNIQNRAGVILNRVQIGELPSFCDLWDLGNHIVQLGERALPLAEEAGRRGKAERTLQDIAWVAQMMELLSARLREVAQHLGLPYQAFPLFISPLRRTAVEATSITDVLRTSDIEAV